MLCSLIAVHLICNTYLERQVQKRVSLAAAWSRSVLTGDEGLGRMASGTWDTRRMLIVNRKKKLPCAQI